MINKENLYKKLIRIRYNNKVFDIFSGEDHRKTFLEVRIENEKEIYYYPILKDYIGLNNIYNKPFDGILHSKKYDFKSKVVFSGCIAGLSLIITQMVTQDYLDYKLEKQVPVYTLASQIVNKIGQENIGKLSERIDQLIPTEEKILQKLSEMDPSLYYIDGSQIMIYDNDILTALGIPEVSFDDVRTTLVQNKKIPDREREYMEEFLNRLEKRFPNTDLRILNNNWKMLEYVEDIESNSLDDGYWSLDEGKIHLKKEYIDKKSGQPDEEKRKEKILHELVHTLNYGKIIIVDKETSKEIELVKFFQRSNYGESFSEGFTTIFTDYLLSDNVKGYFENEESNFSSYQITTPYCYQILKGMDNYGFYDFINKDVSYFDQKVKEYGFDPIPVLDAYFESLDDEKEIEILETEELNELTEDIIRMRIEQEIKNGSNNFKILSILEELSFDIENKYDIAQEILTERDDGMIHILSEEEKMSGLSEEELSLKGYATVKVCGANKEELVNISPRMLAIYKLPDSSDNQYHLAYFGTDQKCYDSETNEQVEFQLENQLEFIQVLPQIDMTIQLSLLKDPDFIKVVDQKFEEQDEIYRKAKEEQAKRQAEEDNLRCELEPLIVEALTEGKGDLEICRIISQNTEKIDLAMTIFSEYKEDVQIQYKSPFNYTDETSNTMLSMICMNGMRVTNEIDDAFVIYQVENESGKSYHLGRIEEVDGQTTLYDYIGKQIVEPSQYTGSLINLKEILPETTEYGIIVKEEFFFSPEFINLIEQKEMIVEEDLDDTKVI